nr:glycine-rich RNA-binding protein 10-like [Lolium perenne]
MPHGPSAARAPSTAAFATGARQVLDTMATSVDDDTFLETMNVGSSFAQAYVDERQNEYVNLARDEVLAKKKSIGKLYEGHECTYECVWRYECHGRIGGYGGMGGYGGIGAYGGMGGQPGGYGGMGGYGGLEAWMHR